MASNKRKQDEKHLKMLREMVALPSNKQCFDCHQRGPTYVNMTIGSFVCTSCSGILRGLNPPYRVKSISMASFTPEEMDFLKSHGNELNRKVYLGLYDSRSWPEPDSRDEQKVRDYMVQKYENRRWYVAPTDAMKDEARRTNEAALTTGTKSKTPLRWQLGEHAASKPATAATTATVTVPLPGAVKTPFAAAGNPPGSVGQPPKPQQPAAVPAGNSTTTTTTPAAPGSSSGFDLLGDLGGDPFASNSSAGGGGVANHNSDAGGFADFSNFNSMSSATPAPAATPQMAPQAFPISSIITLMSPPAPPAPLQPLGVGQTPAAPPQPQAPAPPTNTSTAAATLNGGDRYAALADLDSAFSAPATTATSINWGGMPDASAPQPPPQGAGQGGGVNWGATSSASGGVSWNTSTSVPGGGINWNNQPSAGVGAPQGMPQTPASSAGFGGPAPGKPGNPFLTSMPAANPFGGSAAPAPQAGMSVFASTAPAASVNPFGAPTSMAPGQFSQAGGQGMMPGGVGAGQFGAGGGQFGVAPQQAPSAAAGFASFPPMQNGAGGGGFGMPAATPAAFGGAGGFPAQPQQQGQQFMMPGQQPGGWGQMGAPAQPMANPFLNAAAMQNQVPPPSGSSNPFL